ncbi:MAG: 6-phosphogluconate dehydrogenase binding protein [Acidimicrobiaceae bacterium]|nr:6-phosphogluconate dehydrogenase binding protein [Acidimicrobiaceae bacterium]
MVSDGISRGYAAHMRISVLGMGRMGQAIAVRLLEQGHAVAVWNRTPGKCGAVVALGAHEAHEIAEAADGADVVVTSLSTGEAVREVAFGPKGLCSCAGLGLYADASTISAALSAELADHFGSFVAMSIVGSPEAVRAGSAVCLVGGPDAAVEQLGSVLSAVSTVTHRYPAAPLASTAKLTTNLLLLVGIVALAECFAVGRAGGLSDEQLCELLGESPMLAPGLKNRLEAVLSGAGPTWWSLALGAKDASLAIQLAQSANEGLSTTVQSTR